MKRVKKIVAALLGAGVLALTLPSTADAQLPVPQDDAERAVLPDLTRALGGRADLATLDALLARLPRPTPLRGVVQSVRSIQLLEADRLTDARRAAQEAVQLTPGMAMPRILASYVLVFVGMAGAAADNWLEASVIDPEAARRSRPYELEAILGRLRDAGDYARADRMAARMDEIGIIAALAPGRSAAAWAQFQSTFKEQGAGAARSTLTGILSPDSFYAVSLDRRYEALWPDVDRWVGPNFAGVRLRYLSELRREWFSGHETEAAVNYGRALTTGVAGPTSSNSTCRWSSLPRTWTRTAPSHSWRPSSRARSCTSGGAQKAWRCSTASGNRSGR